MHEAALGGHGALVTYLLAQGGVGMLQVVDAKGMTPGESTSHHRAKQVIGINHMACVKLVSW